MNGKRKLVAAGFALTALSYGLARFSYGLLLPEVREDLDLSATAAGWIGGSAFAAYCFGIVFAFAFDRLGERLIAVVAALTATVGMGLVTVAETALGLGLAIGLAGLSTGLTSPPLAGAVARCFEDGARPQANGAINAGTAAGIVLSGIVVLAFPGKWRELYAIFTAVGMFVTVWLLFAMPKGSSERSADLSIARLGREGVGGLCVSAILMGTASTAIWTFGANIMREGFGFSSQHVAIAWIILGAAGLTGAATGSLANRFGIRATHRVSVLLMSFSLIGLAVTSLWPPLCFVVMGSFGLSYIVATGALLLWGIALYRDRPALGLGLPFLVLAVGQTAGAPLFGAIFDLAGSATSLLLFAAIMACAMIPSARSVGCFARSLPDASTFSSGSR